MGLDVSAINFEGSQKSKLQLRQSQIKNLKNQAAELLQNGETLKNSSKTLGEVFEKTSSLAYDNPNASRVNELWKLRMDVQYNFIYDSFKNYKNASINYAKEAVKDLNLLKYVKQSRICISASIFSKVGRNMLKNRLLNKFRTKTTEEKQLMEYMQEQHKNKVM